jgi:hypothetical protein
MLRVARFFKGVVAIVLSFFSCTIISLGAGGNATGGSRAFAFVGWRRFIEVF